MFSVRCELNFGILFRGISSFQVLANFLFELKPKVNGEAHPITGLEGQSGSVKVQLYPFFNLGAR
jgi:hypothetical protein